MARVLQLADLHAPRSPTLEHLVPPPRFAGERFDSYLPRHPTQSAAKERTAAFVAAADAAAAAATPTWRARWRAIRRADEAGVRGLFLDGGFGVGKTHLLAAAFHASAAAPKRYLSFQELVYLIGVLGLEEAKATLGDTRLMCVDEFELDDPGNTLIVRAFLLALFERGGRVITTSNTAPAAQGEGRFDAASFKREIQSLAERFEVVSLDGPDLRQASGGGRGWSRRVDPAEPAASGAAGDPAAPRVLATWPELLATLAALHPTRYLGLIEQMGTLYLTGVRRIRTQGDALRFVHFVDKLYDLGVGLRASGEVPLSELFDPSYRNSAYAKKHERCLSRLAELLAESEGLVHASRAQVGA